MGSRVGTLESAIRELLVQLGEDPQRAGLKDTPQRLAEVIRTLTEGYRTDPHETLADAVFPVEHDQMVVVRDISFFSLCEHHILPFFGRCHVGYIPDGRVIGMSKIPRLVEIFSKRLQLQERLTEEIAQFLDQAIRPMGVGVVVEGYHLCMAMRGPEKDAWLMSSAMKGTFRRDARTRGEFLQLIGQRRD